MLPQIVFVLPCLNEEKSLYQCCDSLGFGRSNDNDDILIIVDNNSIDCTYEIAVEIKRHSPPNKVYVISEFEEGFVPARQAGNRYALSLAENMDIDCNKLLILQVDADTVYPPYYSAAMREAAIKYGKNYLFEACVDYSYDFRRRYAQYISLLESTDYSFENAFRDFEDYIVDDKVVGYWLVDYVKWGGHQREYDLNGTEIYAETTRLYLKAQLFGAKKVNIGNVKAVHSERKVLANPFLTFATAGFPYSIVPELLINMDSNRLINGTINTFTFRVAIIERYLHLIALFYFLPLHIRQTINTGLTLRIGSSAFDEMLKRLPVRTADDLRHKPGVFFSDIFFLIGENRRLIYEEIGRILLKV